MKPAGNNTAENSSLESLAELSEILSSKTAAAINQIDHINGETEVLAINALIEASRAGEAGKAFSIVAEEMGKLSRKIGDTIEKLRDESLGSISELKNIIKMQATNIRGVRLSDLAMTNIDLVDRSLYERSCDVRWWAKDPSMVSALASASPESSKAASARMSVILNAYTVYFDLVLCDANGNVVANGKPDMFNFKSANQKESDWFRSAMAAAARDEFGCSPVHRSPYLDDQLAVIFSCCVRDGATGRILGVLGTVFDWEKLAQEIVTKTPLTKEDRAKSRVCLVDDAGTVLADTDGKILQEAIHFDGEREVYGMKKGFGMKRYRNQECCIGHALSTGYETYSSGWHSVIIQSL